MLSVGAVLLGSSLSWGLWGVVAECKIRTKGNSRLLDKNGYHDTEGKHPRFQKRKFLRLLWPDIWYLVAAVVVSLYLPDILPACLIACVLPYFFFPVLSACLLTSLTASCLLYLHAYFFTCFLFSWMFHYLLDCVSASFLIASLIASRLHRFLLSSFIASFI